MSIHEIIAQLEEMEKKIESLETEKEELLQAIDLKEQALFKRDNDVKQIQGEVKRLSDANMNDNLKRRITRRLEMQNYSIRRDDVIGQVPIIIAEADYKKIDTVDISVIEREYKVKFELVENFDDDRGWLYWYIIRN
jgi:hypothetical protein